MDTKINWERLRTFEAVARLGSLTAAAHTLGTSQSTVSRQISRLEAESGSPLLLRTSPVGLTDRGTELLRAIQPMVDAALAAQSALEDVPELRGQVTLTSVGELVRWELAKRLPSFYANYPHLRLKILADNQITSLAAGEADVALRWARPERGDLVTQRLHTESYGYYASKTLELGPQVPWLGLAGSLARIPEQRHAERVFASRPARLLVEDFEALGLIVQTGLGVAILPKGFAQRLEGLQEVAPEAIGAQDTSPLPARDLWMVVHSSRQHLPKVRALIQWLQAWQTDKTRT